MLKKMMFTGLTLAFSSAAFPHASLMPKDVSDDFAGRQYKEGERGVIEMIIAHGCKKIEDPEGEHLPTIGLSILLPDPTAYPDVFQPTHFGAKPRINANWDKIESVQWQLNQTVESHGHSVEEDTRAIYWLDGKLQGSQYDSFEARLKMPHLAEGAFSCAKVYIPAVQYCKKNHALAWIGMSTQNFPADPNDKIVVYGFPRDNVPEGEASAYAPYFYIKRSGATVDCNETCDPRSDAYDPTQCKEVWPSALEVDQFLYHKPKSIDPALFGGHMMMGNMNDMGNMDMGNMDHGSMGDMDNMSGMDHSH